MTVRPPPKERYVQVLQQCEETIIHIRKLQEIVRETMCQGLSIEMVKHSDNIVNWIEEIEFTIINDKNL